MVVHMLMRISLQVLNLESALLDESSRTHVCITCGLSITISMLQMLRCVSWGHKANKVPARMRQAILEQHMSLLSKSSAHAMKEGQEEEPHAMGARSEFDMLEILQNKILVDDLDHPIRLLGLRADASLVRAVWTVCASLVAIFSYFVKI